MYIFLGGGVMVQCRVSLMLGACCNSKPQLHWKISKLSWVRESWQAFSYIFPPLVRVVDLNLEGLIKTKTNPLF